LRVGRSRPKSTIWPFFMPTEFASMMPEVLMTESTTCRAAAAVQFDAVRRSRAECLV
jgi:hypothetical protein